MSNAFEKVELVLQIVSTIFTILGVLATIAGINCEHSLAAVVYRRLLYRNSCSNSPVLSNYINPIDLHQTILLPELKTMCEPLAPISRSLQHRSA